ncbi:MAG: hypothetical protein V1793_15685 [Pseudomonadota bacterium]
MKKTVSAILAVSLVICLTGSAMADHHGKRSIKKPGILLAAFGSSEASARISFDTIEKKVRAAYPVKSFSKEPKSMMPLPASGLII